MASVKILKLFSVVMSVLLAICLVRTFLILPVPKEIIPCSKLSKHKIYNSTEYVTRFGDLLSIKTITFGPSKYEIEPLIEMHNLLERNYPKIHSSPFISREFIAKYSLLYKVDGTNASLAPYMLCAHLDVVPADLDRWDSDPFTPTIRGSYIYGRGAIDDKLSLFGILEALEHMLNDNFRPQRTFYLAFGHDEEGSGHDGAYAIAKHLEKQQVKMEFIHDEGSVVLQDFGLVNTYSLGLVSVSEKGYLTVKLAMNSTPGHASWPPKETSIVTMCRTLSRFTSNTHRNMFGTGIEVHFLESIAPYANLPLRIVLSNLWLFGPIVSYVMSESLLGNSIIRTSTAVTLIQGGMKDNILPSTVTAHINHRIHPSQSVAEILEYDRTLVNNPSISIETVTAFEPLPISPHSDIDFAFSIIKRSINEVFPNTIVAPTIFIASTDTKWYLNLSEKIYRFSPILVSFKELKGVHGHNERIALENLQNAVDYFHHLIINADKGSLTYKFGKDEL